MTVKKILFIDDDRAQREVLQRFITELGYEVKVAESSREALDILAKEQFPLVITDLSLPDMDGLDLCRHIKGKNSKTIVYALSGYIAYFGEDKLNDYGFDGYLVKPVNYKVLHQAIEGAFEKIATFAKNE